MSSSFARHEFPASAVGWEQIEDLAASMASPPLLGRLMVCLDELFANCRHHGQAGRVTVSWRTVGDSLEIIWEDDGTVFDPIAWLATHSAEIGTPKRIGGAGLFLVAGMTQNLRYARRDIWNSLTFLLT